MDTKCTRCSDTIETGMPRPGMSRFSATATRELYRLKFKYLRMNNWNDAPRASDVIKSFLITDVTLCDTCWGDVLNFIVTTKPTFKAPK